MSKRNDIFTENFYNLFFKCRENWKRAEFEFDKFHKITFWRWYKCNIYIVTTTALDLLEKLSEVIFNVMF